MKKLTSLTAVAVAALALVGCSQDGVINEAPSVNQAIEFGTYLGRDAQTQTRASVIDLKYVKENGFGVFAYYTKNVDLASFTNPTPDFMNNQKVTFVGDETTGKWTYTPIKYWPNNVDDKVSFFAYAPYDENATAPTLEGGKVKIKFTVENKPQNQKDLIWNNIQRVNLTKMNIGTPDRAKINFNFVHALARIGFTLQCAVNQVDAGGTIDEYTTVTVEKVILSKNQHTYATEPTSGVFYTSGTLSFNDDDDAVWSDLTGEQIFTLDENNFTGVTFNKDNNTQKTNKDHSYLMIIPQDFSTNPCHVFIKYKVTTTDDKLTGKESEITNYISKPINTNFQAGNAYTFNLVLGLTDVQIEANETEWNGNDNEQKVDLPENTETSTTPAAGA